MVSYFCFTGKEIEALLDFCLKLKDRFNFTWNMIALVRVILKLNKENQDEAWRQIYEGKYFLS